MAESTTDREARVADLSRARGDERTIAICDGAAAYRAVLLREHEEHGNWMTAATMADAEMRRRFGGDFDRAVEGRGA